MSILLFIIGFAVLVKGADILVKGAVSIAHVLRIAPWVIGLTIVGIGTSIPELSISFLANLQDETLISFGTIAGSNIFNLLFIVGVAALLTPLVINEFWTRDLVTNVGTVLVMLFFAQGGITRGEGAALLLLFIGWVYWVSRNGGEKKGEHATPEFTVAVSLAMVIAGVVGIYVGARWVVDGAIIFAQALGVSETLISLTLVGVGTSLPELVVSLTAALKGNPAMAVGNVIGSNIFDFLGIVGLSALARPILFSDVPIFDLGAVVLAAVLVLAFALLGPRNKISRGQGMTMVTAYLAYIVFIVVRG